MLDFKLLGKKLTESGLWEKPLNRFGKTEIMELAMAIHSAQLKQEKQCGTCWYQGWKGLHPCCRHPKHPTVIRVWLWGSVDCPHWSDWLDKELGPHKLERPEPVALSKVKETAGDPS